MVQGKAKKKVTPKRTKKARPGPRPTQGKILRRILLISAEGDAPALRRTRVLAEALAQEGCHPVQGTVSLTQAGVRGLDALHAEARSAETLGLVVVGAPAAALGLALSWGEPGSSADRLPRILVLFPGFSRKPLDLETLPESLQGAAKSLEGTSLLECASRFFGGALALGADKKSAPAGLVPARPWLLRKSSDPSPDRRLLPRAAQGARGRAARSLMRLLGNLKKSSWSPPPIPKLSSEAGMIQGGPRLDLIAAGPNRLVALFPRDLFPRESIFVLRSSEGPEQRRLLATGSSMWFEAEPGSEAEAEIRGPDGKLLARSGPVRVPGARGSRRPPRLPGSPGGFPGGAAPSSW